MCTVIDATLQTSSDPVIDLFVDAAIQATKSVT